MSKPLNEYVMHRSTRYDRNNFDPKTFLGKTTIIPGTSGSGKSFMLNSILRSISPHVSTLLVFTGSAGTDKSFPMDRYTHPSFIYKNLNMAALERAIDKTIDLTENYNKYTDLVILEATANHLEGRYSKYMTTKMKLRLGEILKMKEEVKNLKSPTKPVIDKHKSELAEMYKKYLGGYKLVLYRKRVTIENDVIRKVLEYIDFVPYSAIVLNDLTDEFASLTNKEKGLFNSILNKGRHSGITLIMLIHTWNGFGTQIRNSAHNIIFTTAALAHSYASGQKMKGAELRTFNNAVEGIISKDRALPEEERTYDCLLFDRPQMKYYVIRADPRGKQVYVGIPYFSKKK